MFTSDVLERLNRLLHAEITLAELERPTLAPVVDVSPQSQRKGAGFKSSFKRIGPEGRDRSAFTAGVEQEDLDGDVMEDVDGESIRDDGGESSEDVDGESMGDADGESLGDIDAECA